MRSICTANVSRRALIGSTALLPLNLCQPASAAAAAAQQQLAALQPGACYTQQGPLVPLELPRLEHTCASCYPACVGDKCLVSISVTYPKGGSRLGLLPPYPLAVFCGGFTVPSPAYRSTAARLASWGWTVVRFDTRDALPLDILDDATSVALLRELINWAGSHPLMRRLADTSRVYLAGHSRGGKLAALAAAADPRVAALCLVDPVDVTRYAPLSDRFPSAAAALQSLAQTGRFLPVAVLGSGLAGECAPRASNYQLFFQAAPSAAWELELPGAGHFSFLDSTTALQRAVCGSGPAEPDDAAVRGVAQAVLVAWGEAFVKAPGTDVISCLAARCGSLAVAEAAARDADSAAGTNISSSLWQQPPWARSSSSSGSSSAWQPPPEGVPLPVLRDRLAQEAAAAAAAAGSSSSPVKAAAAAAAGPSAVSSNSQAQPETKQQQQQAGRHPDGLSTLPRVQTRQEVWAASRAPSPSQLRLLRSTLERLLVAVSYQGGSLQVQARYKNFG